MQVAEVIGSMLGSELPIRVLGYDGSKAGPDTAETALRIVSPRALARLATAPGSLGLARAYVTRELEVEGDLYALLDAIADVTLNSIPRTEQLRLARKLAPIALRHLVSPPDAVLRSAVILVEVLDANRSPASGSAVVERCRTSPAGAAYGLTAGSGFPRNYGDC